MKNSASEETAYFLMACALRDLKDKNFEETIEQVIRRELEEGQQRR